MKGKFQNRILLSLLVLISGCSKDDVVVIPPQVTTAAVTDITFATATGGGTITSDGGGAVTSRGVVWGTASSPTIDLPTHTTDGEGSGTFTSSLTGLTAGTWTIRAYAVNSAGISYGNEITFIVPLPTPVLTTTPVSGLTGTSFNSGGNITNDGGSAISARGVCWNTSANPTISLGTKTSDGTGTGSFSSSVTGLTEFTKYYVRAYATNATTTTYGDEIIVVTIPPVAYGSVTDIVGNTYQTILIGNKTWMAQNLKTTQYRNGDALQSGLTIPTWNATVSGAWIDFNNSVANGTNYGHLYNQQAVTDVRGVCPTGWHIPSSTEWTDLGNFLGGASMAGGKMKETGTAFWNPPNTAADNLSGFSARGGGSLHLSNFVDFGTDGYWWSSNTNTFYYVTNDRVDMRNLSSGVQGDGLSIRCVKD